MEMKDIKPIPKYIITLIQRDGNTDNFSWSWGHYFTDRIAAERHYFARLAKL